MSQNVLLTFVQPLQKMCKTFLVSGHTEMGGRLDSIGCTLLISGLADGSVENVGNSLEKFISDEETKLMW